MPAAGSLWEVALVFLRLSAVGFGGPNAHLALMQDELVARRKWVDEERFLSVVGVTNLLPGPNSSEVAIHLGYLRAGRLGGLVSGIAFAIPSFLAVLALSVLYFAGGEVPARQALSSGLQPAVVAVLLGALWKLRGAVLQAGVARWLGAGLAAGGLALSLGVPGWEPVWLLLGGGIAVAAHGLAVGSLGLQLVPLLVAGAAVLPALAWVFLKTGALLFGGGYVLVPLLQPEVVGRGWLTSRQFLDGIAIGQVTPGPIVMTAAFVGYAVAGVGGALLAALAIYLPSFLAVLGVSGPLLDRALASPRLRTFVAGVTAVAFGAIAAAAVVLGIAALTSPFRWGVFLAAVTATAKGVPVALTIVAAALAGLAFDVLA